MNNDVYHKLRKQMDQYSVGFPATASGIEIKILQKLFTEEQAAFYLEMTMLLEAPEAVANRTGRSLEDTTALMEAMAQKGLLFRQRKENLVRYAAVPFVIGAFEFQLNHIDRELAEMVDDYFQEGFLSFEPNKNIVPLRTIPVNQSVDVAWPVAPYESAREIIKTKGKIAVADCICRTQKGLLEQACEKPVEACIMFGSHADYYVENKMGRYINQKEALDILDAAEKAGLVNQPANMVNPGGMCNCCGDCCGVLRALKRMPRPAEMVFNNFYAEVDRDLCSGCETCLDRCQMDAISLDDDQLAKVDKARCIGCGLCVTTCPSEAMQLKQKPEAERKSPPESGMKLMTQTAELRGTSLIPLSMVDK